MGELKVGEAETRYRGRERERDADRPSEGSRLETQWEGGRLKSTFPVGAASCIASSLLPGLPQDTSQTVQSHCKLSCSLLQALGDRPPETIRACSENALISVLPDSR